MKLKLALFGSLIIGVSIFGIQSTSAFTKAECERNATGCLGNCAKHDTATRDYMTCVHYCDQKRSNCIRNSRPLIQ
jgi:hypothetical protein